MNRPLSIYIGFDAREADAFLVARNSIKRRLTGCIPIHGLMMRPLVERRLYTRPTPRKGGVLWDVISDAPMSTEFAISRFLVPHLAKESARGDLAGWALFLDADMMARRSLSRLFELLDDSKAVMCVKHDFAPADNVKMDGQLQTRYARKNWSSVMAFNCDHPANHALTVDLVNTLPGRDLHRFCWLDDDLIGELPACWNWLAGHSDPAIDPAIVHYTDGVPTMAGYADASYADAWWDELERAVA